VPSLRKKVAFKGVVGFEQVLILLRVLKGLTNCLDRQAEIVGGLFGAKLVGFDHADQLTNRHVSSLDVQLTPPGVPAPDEVLPGIGPGFRKRRLCKGVVKPCEEFLRSPGSVQDFLKQLLLAACFDVAFCSHERNLLTNRENPPFTILEQLG
jgi:hypothetical protein